MSELVRIINHPGLPVGGAGTLGGIVGGLVGQPDCSRFVPDTLQCVPASLPVLGAAGWETFAAVGTVIGVVVGLIVNRVNR